MVYLEYERIKERYHTAQERFETILTEQERLLTKTLPSAITYDRDKVQTSPSDTILINYVIAKDERHIDDQLRKAKRLMMERKKLLDVKEEELRKSMDKYDRVYTLKYLDGYGVNRIARILCYSKKQIYRMVADISENSRCHKMSK